MVIYQRLKARCGMTTMAATVAVCALTSLPTLGPRRAHAVQQARQTTVVTPGARYKAGWPRTLLFGRRYRDLWNTPIEVEFLDLASFAGGLTPTQRGGFGQSLNLRFTGADGREYVFRSVDKKLRVPEALRETFLEEEFQDLKVSAFHPAAALVVAPLTEAAGLLHAEPRLVVMPDDPDLGEYRADYAGLLGTIEERPNEGANGSPGFAGSRRVVSSRKLVKRLEESPRHRVDAREYLKARLLDIWFGDRDRHQDQWRWARFDDGAGYVWRPIPRDRDEAFVANDGLIWGAVRIYYPRFATFTDEYPGIRGLTENGWELDELILPSLERPVWDAVVAELQQALTDAVIAAAVQHMPVEMYAKNGGDLERALKRRRDRLDEKAQEFYQLLARQVAIYATDQSEVAVVETLRDDMVEVRIHARDERSGAMVETPYYRRRFDARETREIRLYLRGGNDRAEIRGTGQANIELRVIGGGGSDTLIESASLKTHLYDGRGQNRFVTSGGTSVDTRRYIRPRSRDPIRRFPLDWHYTRWPIFIVGSNADHGIILGGGTLRYHYGFRKVPYQHRLLLKGGVSTSGRFVFEYESDFPDIAPRLSATLHAFLTGVERVRFHGFGNETVRITTGDDNQVEQYSYLVDPGLTLAPSSNVRLSVGPVLKLTSTTDEPARLVNDTLYGAGEFGQTGARAALRIDTRDESAWTRSGILFDVGGSVFPAVLDVEDLFGEVHGQIATYVSAPMPTNPTLALRAGAKKVWGDVPYHEAAYIGGGGTLRGFERWRFAGDAAVYGNAELRFDLGTFRFLTLPTDFGVFGLADAGRVYVNGSSPGGWHTAGGGGVWFAPLSRTSTVSFAVAHSTEQTSVYLGIGFMF